jgi:alpha-glucosidase
MHDVLRFWLDRGVDGFRADVVHLIGKDEALPDQPPELAHRDLVGVHDHPHTHALLRRIRAVLDAYPDERTMVGEVNLRGASRLVRYYGTDDELPLVFNFALLWAPWEAGAWADVVQEAEDEFAPSDAWPVWVLSNHDTSRARTRFGGSEDRARVAALVLLTLRGTPFLYQGEELGLRDARVPPSAQHDPAGRDRCRAPMPWNASPDHGWPATPWLPFAPSPADRNVDVLAEDRGSILHLYRALLQYRRTTNCLRTGAWQRLDARPEVLAFERQAPGERRRVVANFGDEPRSDVAAEDGWLVDLDTNGNPRRPWDGRLPACAGAILRPVADQS